MLLQIPESRLTSCGDTSCEFLVDPIPRPQPPSFKINDRPRAKRVVMLDHRKPNSITIFRIAKEILESRGIEVAGILEKPGAGVPVADAVLERLTKEEGLVLCGVSDCGSCSAATSIDAIILQQRGVAAVAILTEPFKAQVDRAMAYQTADRDLPLIVLPHPMQNVDQHALKSRATKIADAAEKYLNA